MTSFGKELETQDTGRLQTQREAVPAEMHYAN